MNGLTASKTNTILKSHLKKGATKPVYSEPRANGVGQWYQYLMPNIHVSNGVIDMAKQKACFWVLDMVASYKRAMIKTGETFFMIELFAYEDNAEADFVIHDGGKDERKYEVYVQQHVPYTDIKVSVKLYASLEEGRLLVLLPDEY